MPRPLEDVKVVELTVFVAGPAAGGILCDWGADVVKIEAPGGDIFRNAAGSLSGKTGLDPHSNSPSFYMDNRGKKSVVLDLKEKEGMHALHKLLQSADVFLSNVKITALERLGLDGETLLKQHPRLIVCTVSAYGPQGDDRDRPGYDVGAFWARSSAAMSHADAHLDRPTIAAPAFGDHATGMTAVGGILAALWAREKTGKGEIVSTSLLRTGMYCNGWPIANRFAPLYKDKPSRRNMRTKNGNPLIAPYTAGDGRFFWLLGYESDRHWPGVCKAIGKLEWLEDERFSGAAKRSKNSAALVALMDETFARKAMSEWAQTFDEHKVWWQPVQTVEEIVEDEQAQPGFVTIPQGKQDYADVRSVKGPIDFGSMESGPSGPVPVVGEHTAVVLRETGLTDEEAAVILAQAVARKGKARL